MALLLIGGYGGMGQVLARRLVAKGNRVIIAGPNSAKAQSFADSLDQTAFALDARRNEDWIAMLEEMDRREIQLTGAVNLCGSIVVKPIASTTEAELQQTLEKNLLTSYLTIKHLASRLGQQAGGNLIFMSSVAARIGLANHELISAAKAAVEGLALSAAASFAGKNVRINVVAPALVDTPLAERFLQTEEARRASGKLHPLGRVGHPEDIAAVLEYLLSPETSWMTGQVLSVDGGMSRLVRR